MELNDLKSTWKNSKPQRQEISTTLLDQVTKENYHSKMNRIRYPEIIGSLICVAAAGFILVNFHKLDTVFLQAVGILSTVLLVTLSVISTLSIMQLTIKADFSTSYAEAIRQFTKRKIMFYKLQRTSITMSYLLLVTFVILISKLFTGNDITKSPLFWIFSFSFGYIFLMFFSRFVFRRYKKVVAEGEALLLDCGLTAQG